MPVDRATVAEWLCDRNTAGCLRLRHGLTLRIQTVLGGIREAISNTDLNFRLHVALSLMYRRDHTHTPVKLGRQESFVFDTCSCWFEGSLIGMVPAPAVWA